MGIGAWLRDLGLEQYEEAFHANHIDGSVLSELTAEDLIGLGVTSIGHRRRLLAAIAALRAGYVPTTSPSPQGSAAVSRTALPLREAERRQLTVMFCDLVGSTALSARMDPEDLRELIAAYHRCIAEVVSRFEGFLAKYMTWATVF